MSNDAWLISIALTLQTVVHAYYQYKYRSDVMEQKAFALKVQDLESREKNLLDAWEVFKKEKGVK